MKNSVSLIFLISLLISSCIDYEIYETPVNTIMENYGGELAYGPGVGVGAGSKGAKYDYLSVELSNSLFLEYGISPGYVITHIATEFAKVTPENISEIQVELSSIPTESGNKYFAKTISIEEAKLIISKEDIMHKCFEKIASNNIAELTPLLTDEFKIEFKDNNGESVIKKINEMIGNYKNSVFRGYDFVENDLTPNKNYILLNGLIMGSKQNVDISVIIDPDKSNNQSIIALRY